MELKALHEVVDEFYKDKETRDCPITIAALKGMLEEAMRRESDREEKREKFLAKLAGECCDPNS